jgi:outer membrane immunogenic protein
MRQIITAALGATVLSIACASVVLAADMATREPMYTKAPGMVVDQSYSWTGFYVGVNGGYGWKDTTATYTPNDPAAHFGTCSGFFGSTCIPPASFNMSGGLAGGQVGYNWQLGPRWLVGLETDIDWSRIQGSGNSSFVLGSYGPGMFTASETVRSFGTIRGRIGLIPTGQLLLYGTGGLAYGNVGRSAVMPGSAPGVGGVSSGGFSYSCGTASGMANCFSATSSQIVTGWTVGAGGEYLFANNLSLKAEYLFVNLGRSAINTIATSAVGLTPASFTSNFGTVSFNVVGLGLNYKFGGPVVARY